MVRNILIFYVTLFLALCNVINGELVKYALTKRSVPDTNLNGHTVSGFFITIDVGTPSQQLNVIVDTGSSNFAVAGSPNPNVAAFYNRSASSTADASSTKNVNIVYAEGSWQGILIYDVLSIPSAGLTIPVLVPVTEIMSSDKFFSNSSDWEGILGLGYSDLVQPVGQDVPSVMNKIISQGSLRDIFSLQLCSQPLEDTIDGVLIIGGIEESLGVEGMQWTPLVRKWYYDVSVTGMMVGTEIVDVSCTAFNNDKSIVDSGTTNLRFPQNVFDIVVKMIKDQVARPIFDDDFFKGAKMYCNSQNTSVYDWFPALTIFLPSVDFNKTISLTIYPESYLQYVDGVVGQSCYNFGIYPSKIGTVLGTVVMEQYYVVFDRENGTVGFAQSSCTWINKPVLSLKNGWMNSTLCYNAVSEPSSALKISAYILLGLLCICFIPMCALLMLNWHRNGRCCKKSAETTLSDTSELLAK